MKQNLCVKVIRYPGFSWWSVDKTGQFKRFECISSYVYEAISGKWVYVARLGFRGKKGISSATGLATKEEAMNLVNFKLERMLSKRIHKPKNISVRKHLTKKCS